MWRSWYQEGIARREAEIARDVRVCGVRKGALHRWTCLAEQVLSGDASRGSVGLLGSPFTGKDAWHWACWRERVSPREDLVPDVKFEYEAMFQHANPVAVDYKRMEDLSAGVSVQSIEAFGKVEKQLIVQPWVLRQLSEHCISEISHFLRPAHLAQLGRIMVDPEARTPPPPSHRPASALPGRLGRTALFSR